MSFNFNGFVLRAPRVSPANAGSTAEPHSGVVRHLAPLPAAYDTTAPAFVDASADQYRAAHLYAAEGTTEYLFWAQNNSQLSLAEDDSWWVSDGTGRIPDGDLSVTNTAPSPYAGRSAPAGFGTFTDGSDRVIVVDNGGRSISKITHLVVARGDVNYADEGWVDEEDPSSGRAGGQPYSVLTVEEIDQDGATGIAYLTSGQKTLLEGGLSNLRGDTVVEVRYTLAATRFWWTRNDPQDTRFGWNNQTQRWEPFKGSAPVLLGQVAYDTSYSLSPVMSGFALGDYLPGVEDDSTLYAMLRVGSQPGESAIPVPVFVVLDVEVESPYDFNRNGDLTAVVGRTSGILQLNPSFVAQYTGQNLWYSHQGFIPDADGEVGLVGAGDLYICPIPTPHSRPFLTLGSRRPLLPILVDTEDDLSTQAVGEGEVAIALSTGKVKLSTVDVGKSDPSSDDFDPTYFGVSLYYTGIAMNSLPQPVKAAVRLVGSTGSIEAVTSTNTLYVPDAIALPSPVSGILDLSDGTGAHPALPGVAASVRPGGDDASDQSTGRVRQVEDGVGDTILYSRRGAVTDLVVVDYESDLPSLPFRVPQGTAYIARERGAHGSKVVLSGKDRKEWVGDYVYFAQASFIPSHYTEEALLVSKTRNSFSFAEGDRLTFAVDGAEYTWLASALLAALPDQLVFTAEQVAASLDAVITGTGSAYALNGFVVLAAGDPSTGSVEIGFGGAVKDLSGCAALGFLPGWRVVGGTANWIPDTGFSLGLYRSPLNQDRSKSVSDFRSTARWTDKVIQNKVTQLPFQFLDHPPLEDVPGYDEGVFFQTQLSVGGEVYTRNLRHYEEIQHLFGQRKIAWLETGNSTQVVTQPVGAVDLGATSVVPETLRTVLGGELSVAREGGTFEPMEQDADYLLVGDGQQGVALLVDRVGRMHSSGSRGTWVASSGVFTAPDGAFSDVGAGYRLKILTEDASGGSYTVVSVSDANTLLVTPSFVVSSERPSSWELYEGYTSGVYDPGLVADFVYQEFTHFHEEPFAAVLLSYLADIPSTVEAFVSSRPTAALGGARNSERTLGLRYGLQHEVGAELTPLAKILLGTLANDSLRVPVAGVRYSTGAFSIQVGVRSYVPVGVTTLSDSPATVEYRLSDGLLRFPSEVLSNYASAPVHYVEEFMDPADLQAGQGEYDPVTGGINMPSEDILNHSGDRLYFTEQLVVGTDIVANPQAGSFALRVPARSGQCVEVGYYAAENTGARSGDPIVEFLSVRVRNENAVRVGAAAFTFNSNGSLTVDERITPTVYVGALLQNYDRTDYTLHYDDAGVGHLFFKRTLPSEVVVRVSYAVFEAQGGENTYQASTAPFYRPPFFLEAGQDRFGLRGNRTTDVAPGQLLRLGSECFYIRRVRYFPSSDTTAVTVFPAPVNEVGSRSSGNDVVMVITASPVTTVVDPDGEDPLDVGEAPAGFMQSLPLGTFPFEPVAKGQDFILFRGDLTSRLAPGHLLEIGGRPMTIAQVELDGDGARTRITLTAPFWQGVAVEQAPSVKVSLRPIYPPQAKSFLGRGPVLGTEGYEVVRWDEEGLGQTLTPNLDYRLDESDGGIQLSERQDPLAPREKLSITFTKRDKLSPLYQDGALILPRYRARYKYVTSPSDTNGYLNATLRASYTFSHPDTFYVRVVPLSVFLGEAVQEIQDSVAARQPSSGVLAGGSGPSENWQQGRVGLGSERRHLLDKDRVARSFLDFYNQSVQTFEQSLETISGLFVGDRDGKFRFYVGRGAEHPTPGYEDEITGDLLPRSLWGMVFSAHASEEIYVTEEDYVVAPSSATLVAGAFDGTFLDSDSLDSLLREQTVFVRNDVDDRVLVGLGSTQVERLSVAPYRKLKALGEYRRLAEPHQLSRLFPGRARVFFTTYPGVGATATDPAGRYTWGVTQDGRKVSTYRKDIAQVSNPALGEIRNITDGVFFQRRARARIWGYYPDGLPAGAFLVDGVDSPAIDKPCLIAAMAPLKDVVVDSDTGYPDRTQFALQGGTLPDLEIGDLALSVPGFVEGAQLAFGVSDGALYSAFNLDPVDVFGKQGLSGVFVGEVLYGCVLTFADFDGTPITDKSKLLVGTTDSSGVPAHQFGLGYGDTVLAVAISNSDVALSDPPTTAEMAQVAQTRDAFQLGFDLALRTSGKLVDLSLPSFEDPYFLGLKEILGQKSALPLHPMEGVVEFLYGSTDPFEIPALRGETKDDSGDHAVPYLSAANTELSRLDQAANKAAMVVTASNGGQFLYPDEVLAVDGEIIGVAGASFGSLAVKEPAALLTFHDMSPFTHQPTEYGLGDVRPYDLLLVEVGQASVGAGAQGLLTVGAVSSPEVETGEYGGILEPPRFVTATTPPPADGSTNLTGSPVRYTLTNAVVHVDGYAGSSPQVALPSGILLSEVDSNGDAVLDRTILDFSSLSDLVLYNGLVPGQGGLNDIFSADTGDARSYNQITLKLYARADVLVTTTPSGNPLPSAGSLLYTITFRRSGINVIVEGVDWDGTTTLSQIVAPGDVTFGTGSGSKQIYIQKVGIVDLNAVGADNAWFLPYAETDAGLAGWTKTGLYGFDFSLSVDTYAWDGVDKGQSKTAWVGNDRLTFNEVLDLRLARERGYTHPLNIATNLETSLLVHEVTCGNGVSSTVNRDVNGGTALTFVARSSGVGNWTPASLTPSTEYGSLKAMGFEAHGNTPILATDVVFSAIPSSDYGREGVICTGTGSAESKSNGSVSSPDSCDDRVFGITVASGAVSRVESGDVLVIEASGDATHSATTKAGTYLVRYALEANDPDTHFHTNPTTMVVDGTGWISQAFPTVSSFDSVAGTLTVDQTTGFPATGRVYVVLNASAFTSTDMEIYNQALFSASYTTLTGTEFSGLASYKWAGGGAPSADELVGLESLVSGKRVSGMSSLALQVQNTAGLPATPVVGVYDALTPGTPVFGVQYLHLTPPSGAAPLLFDSAGVGPTGVVEAGSVPSAGNIAVEESAVVANLWEYQSDPSAVVYNHVPGTLHLNLTDAQWVSLNDPNGLASGDSVSCLLPGTLATLENLVGDPGFVAQGGIFLEPSFPQSVFNLGALSAHVVDASHDLTMGAVGMRNFASYVGAGEAAPATPEGVAFSVRRIRRFHEAQEDMISVLSPLRFAYEIRRGEVTAYAMTDKQFGLLDAESFIWDDGHTYDGTQLGTFTDPNVGIHAGDLFRLLADDGTLLEEVEIVSVESDTRIKLAAPGVLSRTPVQMVGMRFEVYLRQVPVPHEQTNEQLLALITSETLLHTHADRDAQLGGYVPAMPSGGVYASYANLLYDDLNVDGTVVTYTGLGVQAGDIVVVDPAGILPTVGGLPSIPERGMRPFGDTSISARSTNVPNPYVAGSPNPLDDNRGFYRVVEVHDDHLVVSGASRFTGDAGDDVVFPEDAAYREDFGYTLYPTISASELTGGAEGQMDLRPTQVRDAVTKSYADYPTPGDTGAAHSIRPFSYRIIRPSALFSQDAVDLVLAMRERTLSLIEMLRAPVSGEKSGTYYVFQRDEHASDLGDPTKPQEGLGVSSNALLQGLIGQVGFSPFVNTSDCTSIHDRRFWILDSRMDGLEPKNSFSSQRLDGGVAYTDYEDSGSAVRPLLPDMIDMVLDTDDRLRAVRYAWLSYRTNRLSGTLASIERFDEELPKRLAEVQRSMLMVGSAEEA